MNYLKEYIPRTISCLTNRNDFQSLISIKEFPVFFGVTEDKEEDDLYANMEWYIEPATGLIQLNNLIPLDILYQAQHAYGFGETWENHYQKFSSFLMASNPNKVLEIGAGQGRIAQICSANESVNKWTIIEPNPTFEATDKIQVQVGFFDSNFKSDDQFDTYTFSHVLEHAYNPRDFLQAIYDVMGGNDKLIFSYPNLEAWLRNKFTNSLNFEHTIFLAYEHLVELMNDIGFEISREEKYLEHSYFFEVKKGPGLSEKKVYSSLSDRNRLLLLDFIKYHNDEVDKLNSYMEAHQEGDFFLFGAHIFSQYLKVFGLKTNKIISILDNSIQKQKKRLYGTKLLVESPEVLSSYENPIVILRAGPYNDEIRKQISEKINSKTIFV